MSKDSKDSEVSIEEQINSEVKKTDFGQLIYDFRKPLLGGLVLLLIGVGIYSFMKTQSGEKAQESQMAIYQFQQENLQLLKDKKLSSEEFITKLKKVSSQVDESSRLMPVVQEAFKAMKKNKDIASAKALLEYYWNQVKSHPYTSQIVGANLIALCEEEKDYKKGIEVIEELVKSRDSILPAYFYLNLGRFYQKVENIEKAKANYNHLMNKYPDTEEAKIAKVLVHQVAQ